MPISSVEVQIAVAGLVRSLSAASTVSGQSPRAKIKPRYAEPSGNGTIGLLSLAALGEETAEQLIAHCRRVAEAIPLFGFYLQPAVGGRLLDYDSITNCRDAMDPGASRR